MVLRLTLVSVNERLLPHDSIDVCEKCAHYWKFTISSSILLSYGKLKDNSGWLAPGVMIY